MQGLAACSVVGPARQIPHLRRAWTLLCRCSRANMLELGNPAESMRAAKHFTFVACSSCLARSSRGSYSARGKTNDSQEPADAVTKPWTPQQ